MLKKIRQYHFSADWRIIASNGTMDKKYRKLVRNEVSEFLKPVRSMRFR